MNGRDYCTCTVVQNYDYDRAAEKLGCKPRFLQDNISRLPHQKLGEASVFCDCELRLIMRMHTIAPAQAAIAPPASDPVAIQLHQIRPARGRNRSRTG